MSKTGKDVVLEYCSTVKTHDIGHLQNCLDNEIEIKKGNYKDLTSCPSAFGLDDFDGLCMEEDLGDVTLEVQCEQCDRCWLQALNMKVEG